MVSGGTIKINYIHLPINVRLNYAIQINRSIGNSNNNRQSERFVCYIIKKLLAF